MQKLDGEGTAYSFGVCFLVEQTNFCISCSEFWSSFSFWLGEGMLGNVDIPISEQYSQV